MLLLGCLLSKASILHISCKILADRIHQSEDSTTLLSFLLIREKRNLWRRWRCHMSMDLCKCSSCDDFFLHGHLGLGRGFVKRWIIELLHTLTGLGNETDR